MNLGVFHEQILYKDGTNSGFSFADPDTSGYSCKDKEYDDALMRKQRNEKKSHLI